MKTKCIPYKTLFLSLLLLLIITITIVAETPLVAQQVQNFPVF
jgi:hypothetical protein